MAVVQLSQLACASTRHTGDDFQRPPATAILVYPGGFLRSKCSDCLTLFLNYHASAEGLTRWDYGVFQLDGHQPVQHYRHQHFHTTSINTST